MIIHGLVYDVTALLAEHPGGEELLLNVAGMDATADYDEAFHPESVRGCCCGCCTSTHSHSHCDD